MIRSLIKPRKERIDERSTYLKILPEFLSIVFLFTKLFELLTNNRRDTSSEDYKIIKHYKSLLDDRTICWIEVPYVYIDIRGKEHYTSCTMQKNSFTTIKKFRENIVDYCKKNKYIFKGFRYDKR